MYFLFPQAWYLLPLIIIPWAINLYRYLKGQTVQVPSLFFLEKLLKKKYLSSNTNRWLEMLVESLFLLGLIVLLSRPVFAEPVLNNNRLLVLLDDSPSMKYHFLTTDNDFFKQLEKWLEENTYEQIEIIPLSALNHKEPLVFRGQDELKKFYPYFITYLHNPKKTWTIDDIKVFMNNQLTEQQFSGYDYIIYTDGKKNHFKKDSVSSNPKDTFYFPKVVNISSLPVSPTIQKVKLEQENYFVGENIEVQMSIDLATEKNLIAEIRLDDTVMYRKQIISSNVERSTLSTEQLIHASFPAATKGQFNQQKAPVNNPNLNANNDLFKEDAARLLTITLYKNQIAFAHISKVINIYSAKTISFLPSHHPQIDFFKTIFAYDLERGHLAISPQVSGSDVIVVLDFIELMTHKFNDSKSYLIFLNSEESPFVVNQAFKKWGLNHITINNRKNANVLDKLETPFITGSKSISANKHGVLDYFVFDFTSAEVFPFVTIQKQPMIFRYQNLGIFNGISLANMTSEVDPNHLIWVYEMLFSFFGGKKIKVIKDNSFSLALLNTNNNSSAKSNEVFLKSILQSHPLTKLDTRLANDAGIEQNSFHDLFYYPVVSPTLDEYNSEVITDWDKIFSQAIKFLLVKEPNTSQQSDNLHYQASSTTNINNALATNFLGNSSNISRQKNIASNQINLFRYFFQTTTGLITLLAVIEIFLLIIIVYWLIKRTKSFRIT